MTKERIKDLIIQTIRKENPETVKQLVNLMQMQNSITPTQTTSMIIELENENCLLLSKRKYSKPLCLSPKSYVFSKQTTWYWIIIIFAAITTISMVSNTSNGILLSYFRYTLGVIFLLFLPGFSVTKAIFPKKVFFNKSSKEMDAVERVTLSIGMSFIIVPMVGLVLNYTFWGVGLIPLTLALMLLILTFSTTAVFREYSTKMTKTKSQS